MKNYFKVSSDIIRKWPVWKQKLSGVEPSDAVLEVSDDTKRVLDGLRKEIIAGKVLAPKTDANKSWNNCADRAVRILDMYKKGKGLFQQ